MFVSIAFDSGGVASGPMTTTFLLPLNIGACDAVSGNLMTDAFGVVALVALTPLIAIQIMGILYQYKLKAAVVQPVEADMADNECGMIMTIVKQGFSEDVMNAARLKGASGGTVFHSWRVGNEEALRFWKISVQEEREVVLILARKEDKLEIMQEIGKQCGIQSKAHGVVISLPMDSVVGLD